MDIFYTNETLYVNMSTIASSNDILKLKKRIFRIAEEYNIDNVVLNIVTDDKLSKELVTEFIKEYRTKFNGKIMMKK